MPIPKKDYKVIYADNPWTPTLGATWKTRFTDKARPQKQYDTMPLEDLCKLEVPSAKQAQLYLWVVNQHVDWGYEVARVWGFEPWQMLTWHKPGLGVGHFQCNTEHLLLCRKGPRHGYPFPKTKGTCFRWSRGKHSEKPVEVYELIESACQKPRLELFARRRREGWDSWGLEVPKDIQKKLEVKM